MQIYEPFTEKPGPGAIFDKKIYLKWDGIMEKIL